MNDEQQQVAEKEAGAQGLEMARADFLARMTHEFRTPLNAIAGFTQLLETADNLTAEQRENLKEIACAGKQLQSMVDEALALARLGSDQLSVNPERVALSALIEECLALLEPLAASQGVRLVHRLPNSTLLSDRGRLKQVLLNLLSNAIRYNRRGGQVVIQELRLKQDTVRIEVHDTGPGISEEQLANIFNPFKRLEAGQAPGGGRGLGLMISRHLVGVLQGRIDVFSELGSGSIFWVDLPLAWRGSETKAAASPCR